MVSEAGNSGGLDQVSRSESGQKIDGLMVG